MKKFFIALFICCMFIAPTAVLADSFGVDATAGAAGLSQKYNAPVETLVGNIIGAALSLIGVIFFILMVYGGMLIMTARGDSALIEKGKESIIAATIGLVIVLGSYAITQFVFESAETGPTSGPIIPQGNVE